ncbi:hypothetical protein [Desulfobacula sp.]
MRQEDTVHLDISIKKASGEMLFSPHFETLIEPGDTVIVMGKTLD